VKNKTGMMGGLGGKYIKKEGLRHRWISRTMEKEGVKQHRIFTDVNFERLGGPPTHGLNGSRRNSCFGKGDSTTST
jgi:hypothetical protein